MTKLRLLKVSTQTRVNGRSFNRSHIKRSPKIQLAGDWVAKAGFAIGEIVEVLVTDEFIQIVKKGGRA